MKHILVTGGGGYIGSSLVRELIDRNYTVRVFDSFYFGKESLKNLIGPLEIIKGDIREIDASALKGIDAIIHLAALSNDHTANVSPKLTYEINTLATERLAKLAKRAKVPKLIFASSTSIYHRQRSAPPDTENNPVTPEKHYSLSKFLAEKKLFDLADKTFKVVIFRMATVGGVSPRMRFDLVINAMVKSALEQKKVFVFSGKQYRPVIDIRDVIRAYILALNSPINQDYQYLFNIAYKNYTVSQIAKEVVSTLNLLGVPVSVIKMHPKQMSKNYKVSTEKIEKLLDFKALYSPSDTVKELFKHLKSRSINEKNSSTYSDTNKIRSLLTKLKLKYI